jgi:hypothetical protein
MFVRPMLDAQCANMDLLRLCVEEISDNWEEEIKMGRDFPWLATRTVKQGLAYIPLPQSRCRHFENAGNQTRQPTLR